VTHVAPDHLRIRVTRAEKKDLTPRTRPGGRRWTVQSIPFLE